MSPTHSIPAHTHKQIYAVAAITAVLVLVALVWWTTIQSASAQTTSGTPCYNINISNIAKYNNPKYASAVDLFDVPGMLLMSVFCNEKTATAQVGYGMQTQYIYKYGYERVGDSWKKITFSGEKTVGPWIIGNATAALTLPDNGETGKVLAYMCHHNKNTWKCGCSDKACASPKWQMQEFSPETDNTPVGGVPITTEGVLDDSYLVVYGVANSIAGPLVKAGQKITFTGKDFGGGIEVHFGDEYKAPAQVINATTLSVTAPDIDPGVYTVWFTSKNKRSRNITLINYAQDPDPLKINSVSPSLLQNGSRVTITGEGFTEKGNVVYVGGAVFRNLSSSDGKTITFTLEPDKLSEHDIAQEVRYFLPEEIIDSVINLREIPSNGTEVAMDVQMINANGASNVYKARFK